MSNFLETTFFVLSVIWILVGTTHIILNINKINQLKKKPTKTISLTPKSDLSKPFGLDESEDDPADWWKREQKD